jgi:hypothetical protein
MKSALERQREKELRLELLMEKIDNKTKWQMELKGKKSRLSSKEG